MKVKATVILEFEDGNREEVTIDGSEVLGNWKGLAAGQARAIYDVTHPSVNGIYQHHNVGVAILDLLRVAIIQLNPDWCKTKINVPTLARSTAPTLSAKDGAKIAAEASRLMGPPRCVRCGSLVDVAGRCMGECMKGSSFNAGTSQHSTDS